MQESHNDIIDSKDKSFEKKKDQVVHLQPILDLSELYLFKVIKNNQLVDKAHEIGY